MPLNPTVAAVKRNLPRVAASLGFQARVTSAYRSRAKQTALYRRYLQGLQPYPVAVPGTSDHERGLALDIVSTNTEALVSIMAQAGFRWAGPSDPVHFAYIGPQIASQPQKRPISASRDEAYINSLPRDVQNFVLGRAEGAEKVTKDIFTTIFGILF